jgi:indole-3-glycerol phosphate synthase
MWDALSREHVAVIAELKRRSPSKGTINAGLDARRQAERYETGGASALSVLTEPSEFGGADSDLAAAAAGSRLPLLKKDFHVAPVQLLQAGALGATAALVIVRAVPPGELDALMAAARDAGVEVLAEVRDEGELERALAAGTAIIGVNNRDLETLHIDRGTCERLIPLIPADRIAVAESGLTSAADVAAMAAVGADAVLIGSVLSAAEDPIEALAPLVRIARVRRGA